MYEFKQEDVYNFAAVNGFETEKKGSELFFKYCPYCKGGGHDKESFSINLKNGLFKCFRASCGMQGHFVELARDFGYKLDFGEHEKKYRKLPQKKIETKPKAVEYLKNRGISQAIAERYKITVQNNAENVLVFPFYDEENIMQFVKYRKTDFVKGRDKAKEWCEKDTKPILFGMAQCEDFETLIITEGQIDSLSVAEAGYKNAVSVPTGAMGFTWLSNCWDWICQFKKVVVFGDCEHGKITLLDKLRASLKTKVYSVRITDYLGEKDANDILRKYGTQAIQKAVENAEIQPLKYVKQLADVKSVDLMSMPKILTGINELDRTIGGLYFGQVILLSGKRGEGKSTLMSQFIAEAINQDCVTFVYSGELPNYHFKNWLDLQIAGGENISAKKNEFGDEQYYLSDDVVEKINSWYRDKAYIFDNSAIDDEEYKGLIEIIEDAICRYDIKLICLDNLMTAIDFDANSNLYQQQSLFVKKLAKISKQYDVCIILIAHPKKPVAGQDFNNDSVSGSSDITNAVDVVLNYQRSKPDDAWDGELMVTKNRLTGRLILKNESIKLIYSNKSKRICSWGCFNEHKRYSLFDTQDFYEMDETEPLPF